MSKEAGRYCRAAIGVLCGLSLVWTVTVAAPQGGPASAGWGDYPQSAADAARFLDYSTWGPTPGAIVHLGEVGYSRFLDEQFDAPMSSYQDFPIVLNTRPTDCVDACQRDNYTPYPLQTRFYTNALYGNDQLRQRVAFALHQIFVVSAGDIPMPSRFAPYLKILDRNAFGNYRQLLHEITLNPAMGNYLDMAGNLAANPNENYAREVLQLFSIGLNQLNPDGTPMLGADGQPVPAYDQDDVNAFSRVFTGWNFATAPQQGVTNYFVPMTATQSRHDVGSKILLQGVTLSPNQTAAKDLSDALDNIFQHPNVGPFICRQLIQHLVTSNPSPAYVRRVAEVFANNGANVRGDLRAVVRAILLDDEAYANPPDSSKGHLKHPVLFVTNLLRAIGARSADGNGLSDGYLNPQSQGMGMDLFVPPSVFSYFSPATGVPGSSLRGPEFGTLNTSTAIRRANFVNTMVFSRINVSTTFAPNGTSLNFPALQALASTPEELVLMLNTLMMGGRMSQPMYDTILAAVKAVPSNNPLRRAQTAVYLTATSAQYQVAR